MNRLRNGCLALLVMAGVTAVVVAQGTPPATRVTLTELHCMGCAKTIASKVAAVPGVAEMRVQLKSKTIWAIHKPGMTPSPRAIWEAIEATDHTPTRMDAPSGSYTSKPQS